MTHHRLICRGVRSAIQSWVSYCATTSSLLFPNFGMLPTFLKLVSIVLTATELLVHPAHGGCTDCRYTSCCQNQPNLVPDWMNPSAAVCPSVIGSTSRPYVEPGSDMVLNCDAGTDCLLGERTLLNSKIHYFYDLSFMTRLQLVLPLGLLTRSRSPAHLRVQHSKYRLQRWLCHPTNE